MTFSMEWVTYLNILIVIVLLGAVIQLTRKGLLLGLIHLLRVIVALIAAMILSGPLAEVFPLLNYKSGGIETIVANILSVQASQPIWFIIVVLAVFLITKLVEPLIKLLDEAPIISSLNRIGGFVLGLIVGGIKVALILVLFTTPFIKNGEEVIEASYLSYARDTLSIVDGFAKPLTDNLVLQKYSSNQSLNEDEAAVLEELMNKKGLGHDQIVDFLESIKNE